jgi:hypothetical protein
MAALCHLVSVAFVGISFSTDNWKHVSVNRGQLLNMADEESDAKFSEVIRDDWRYFDRVEGLYRMCFPMVEKPKMASLYLNPVDEWCTSINFTPLYENDFIPDHMTWNGQVWIHTARATIAVFILFFIFAAFATVVGLWGCWSVSTDKLIATAILMLFAFLWGTSGMVLFHVSHFYELHKVI